MTPVAGVNAAPDSSAEYPSDACRFTTTKKKTPPRPA